MPYSKVCYTYGALEARSARGFSVRLGLSFSGFHSHDGFNNV